MKQVKKAIIPAAGFGTRFLPFTKSSPKEMLPIIDKPTLQYIVEEIVDSGIEEILIIIGSNKKSIEDHFDRACELEALLKKSGKKEELELVEKITYMADIHFIRQKEMKGLGHAVLCGKAFVGDEPFAVLLGDDVVYNNSQPATKQLIEAYNKTGKSILGVQRVPKNQVNKYGIIDPKCEKDGIIEINGVDEKPNESEAKSDYAVLGRYIINPEIFDILKMQKAGKGGEIQLTDALCKLTETDSICAYEFEGRRYDIGSKQGFLEATCEYALRDETLKDDFSSYLKKLISKL